MKTCIEISDDEFDCLLISRLTDDHNHICQKILELKNKSKLQSFEKEDLKHFKKVAKGIRRVLKYYMVHEDYVEKFGTFE